MDDQEFRSATFQRVYQYLEKHVSNINLDNFQYKGNPEGTPVECLKLLLQYAMCVCSSKMRLQLIYLCLDIVEYRIHPGLKYITLQNF